MYNLFSLLVVAGLIFLFIKDFKLKIFSLILLFLLGLSLALNSPVQVSQTTVRPQNSVPKKATPFDSFHAAVNQAMSAAKFAQTAKSGKDWNLVASQWQEGIELMKAVPNSSPNYSVAQRKVIEYQKNFKYAKENADRQRNQIQAQQTKLLDRIAARYGYRPQIIMWGAGKALTVPDIAWTTISQGEKEMLIDYARSGNSWVIITGRVKGASNMFLDQTVMCLDKRALDSCT